MAQTNNLTALNAAVTKAGLATTLSDPNASVTVFAPTDAAFGTLATRLGFASAAALVDALPPTTLASILSHYVLPTKKSAADLTTGGASQTTLYRFGGASTALSLQTTNGVASDGVVHVIGKVLVPPGVLNIVQMAQVNPIFTTLVGAVVATNLQGTLSGAGPFTVFAPTNDAFAAIQSTVAGLSTAQLTEILTRHVLPSQVPAANIPFVTPITTVEGETSTVHAGAAPTITDKTTMPGRIVATDVRASSGVIHVIGKVLIPTL